MLPIANFASADALIEIPPKEVEKPIHQPDKRAESKDNNKFNRSSKPKFKRRGGAAHSKVPVRKSLDIVPRRRVFPVFTSNLGCTRLSEITYQVILGKDFRLAQNITRLQLEYVLTTAFNNRLVQTALKYGYAFPEQASRLKQVSSGIQLPDILSRYIESVGIVKLASNASVVPFCADYRTLYPVGTALMRDPAVILEEAGRPVPPGPWALDIPWIVQYNDSTTRAGRSGMKFRTVDNSSYEGRVEMLVSYVIHDDLLLPKAPQAMTEAEAQLGACYSFRNYNELFEWFGENFALLFDAFTAIPIDPRIVFSDACVTAFAGSTVGTD